jgi:hypothetical protein
MKNYLREQWYRTNGIDGIDLTSTLRMSTKPGPYRHAQRSPKFYRNIAGQLQALHMSGFQGREHSGIDVSLDRSGNYGYEMFTGIYHTGREKHRTNLD